MFSTSLALAIALGAFSTGPMDPQQPVTRSGPELASYTRSLDVTASSSGASATLGAVNPGACCDPTTGQCTDQLEADECFQAGGVYYGTGSTCAGVTCVVLDCPAGGQLEGEPQCPGGPDTFNGGCNDPLTPIQPFSKVTCGQTICGEAWANEGERDTDWYEYQSAETELVTWSVTAEFASVAIIIELSPGFDPCDTTILAADSAVAGATATVTQCLAGDRRYVLFVAPTDPDALGAIVGQGVACADYFATATCAPCVTGACCLETGECAELPEVDCVGQGGIYNGDDASCLEASCAGACCLLNGACVENTSQQACGAQNGIYFGGGSVCAGQMCTPCIPEGELDCGDPVDTVNGGCNSEPAVFSDVQCGDVICGSMRSVADGDGSFDRDTDWYRLDLATSEVVTIELTDAAFPATLIRLTPPNPAAPCDDLEVGLIAANAGTDDISATVCLPAGVHYILLTSTVAVAHNAPCPSTYRLALSCTTGATGACCTPDGGCVDDVSRCECEGARGGIFQGAGTACDNVACIGACCLPNGFCIQAGQIDCGNQNGVFQGGGSDCGSVACRPCLVEGEPNCGTPQTNGGCDQTPAAFVDIDCGDTICGTIRGTADGKGGFSRDTDWYRITTATPTTIRIRLSDLTFPAIAFVVVDEGNDCAQLQIPGLPVANAPGQPTAEGAIAVPAGTHYVFVSTSTTVVHETPCPTAYRLQVDFLPECPNCGPCGDSSCDGSVSVGDINFFVAAVTGGEAAWNALFPGGNAPCDYQCANDANGDGSVSVGDINGFVTAVTSGQPCQP